MNDAAGEEFETLGPEPAAEPGAAASDLEATVAEGLAPGKQSDGWRLGPGSGPVGLPFLARSARNGSLGRIGGYEILGVLGRGSMGIVLRGYDRALDRAVAIKVHDPSPDLGRRARVQFLREARAAAAVNHPNVVTIYAVNVVRERPYLAMEYVAGTLCDRIKAGYRPDVVEVLRIALQLAQGLAAAHEQGVIHRDVKPANILLEEGTDRVKISDFGLALASAGAAPAARPREVVGTPAFMSPEQVRGDRIDARSDLFSLLGCVLYAVLAGRSPFVGADPIATARSVCEREPHSLPEADAHAARSLNGLILRLLAKVPGDRPRSAQEVASALKVLLDEANRAAAALAARPRMPGQSHRPSAAEARR